MFNFRTTQALHPQKTPWITHRGYAQYDVDLPSESEGRGVFIVNNFRRAKPLVHRPWTFPYQAELMDDAFGSGLAGINVSSSFKTRRMVHVRTFSEWGVSGSRFGVEPRGSWVLSLGFGVRMSAGVFPPPAPTCFQTLSNTLS